MKFRSRGRDDCNKDEFESDREESDHDDRQNNVQKDLELRRYWYQIERVK